MSGSGSQGGGLSPIRAALTNRCVNCGRGPLDIGFLKTIDRCAVCGADYRRHAAGDGAVFIVLTILSFFAMGVVVSVELLYSPPGWVHLGLALLATIGPALLLLPPVKRFMVAQSFAMDALGEGFNQGGGEDPRTGSGEGSEGGGDP